MTRVQGEAFKSSILYGWWDLCEGYILFSSSLVIHYILTSMLVNMLHNQDFYLFFLRTSDTYISIHIYFDVMTSVNTA